MQPWVSFSMGSRRRVVVADLACWCLRSTKCPACRPASGPGGKGDDRYDVVDVGGLDPAQEVAHALAIELEHAQGLARGREARSSCVSSMGPGASSNWGECRSRTRNHGGISSTGKVRSPRKSTFRRPSSGQLSPSYSVVIMSSRPWTRACN